MAARKPPKVALVREFMTQYGGAERVFDWLLDEFPDAPVYTLIYDEAKMGKRYAHRDIRSSKLQHLPLAKSHYKWYLPLMPWAIDNLELPSDLDLVISDSSAFAKGVKAPVGVPHLCYLHTPTRYLWSVRDEYVRDAPIPGWVRPFVGPVLDAQKRWDYLAAQRPDAYIANSDNVASRLMQYYDRTALSTIFPFVDIDKFAISKEVGDYVLAFGRIEPYKRFDLVIEACIQLGWPLKIGGAGSWLERYKLQYAAHANIEFLGRVPDEALADLYANAKVFVFPAEEDAGITPLEAMASGRPVLAYAKGGALESIKAGVTGEFFAEQTMDALADALTQSDWKGYNQTAIRAHAELFSLEHFQTQFRDTLNQFLSKHQRRSNGH